MKKAIAKLWHARMQVVLKLRVKRYGTHMILAFAM
jgi:hypothetical protein